MAACVVRGLQAQELIATCVRGFSAIYLVCTLIDGGGVVMTCSAAGGTLKLTYYAGGPRAPGRRGKMVGWARKRCVHSPITRRSPILTRRMMQQDRHEADGSKEGDADGSLRRSAALQTLRAGRRGRTLRVRGLRVGRAKMKFCDAKYI